MQRDTCLEEVLVKFFAERQIRQEHCDYYAAKQKYSLKPGLFRQTVASLVELDDALVPSVNGYQFGHNSSYASFDSLTSKVPARLAKPPCALNNLPNRLIYSLQGRKGKPNKVKFLICMAKKSP